MKFGRVLFRRPIAAAFLSQYVQQHRTFNLGGIVQGFHQIIQVMTIKGAKIVKTKPLKQHARRHKAFQRFFSTFGDTDQITTNSGDIIEQVFRFLFEPDKGVGGHLAAHE